MIKMNIKKNLYLLYIYSKRYRYFIVITWTTFSTNHYFNYIYDFNTNIHICI